MVLEGTAAARGIVLENALQYEQDMVAMEAKLGLRVHMEGAE